MQEKLAITVIVITLALFALVYVLYHIINTKQDSYNQIVLSQQEYDSRVIAYRRGDIVDRNGTYLATTEKVYNLIIDPRQIMSDEEDYLNASVTALVTVFGYDEAEMRTLITENSTRSYVRYKRQLSHDLKEAFETYQTETNRAFSAADSHERVKGVWFEDEYRRVYPYDSLACFVIGFSGSDSGMGTGGIEQSYNDYLSGTNGREYGYLNDDSNLERVIKPAVNGSTVVSTIDLNIQNAVENRITQWVNETNSKQIGVVVMDPDNGEVLAMASKDPYDLNNPRDLQDRYTDEEIRQLGLKEAVDDYRRKNREQGLTITEDQVTEYYTDTEIRSLGEQVAWNQIWRNYCVSDTYEPGSPAKIFTVSAALEEGIITPEDTFYCDGYQQVGDYMIKCTAYSKGGHGMLTLEESLMQSCNDAMMQIAARIGTQKFSRYQHMFGFGSKTGIDLPGEADTSSLVYTAENMQAADLATSSFGQTFNCTMIQMAAAYCSVINGGSYYEPHVVRQILNEQGSVTKKIEPRLVRETVSESTASFIREALFQTVEKGTGKAAGVEGYRIAGKTGTAEKIPRGNRKYVVSFCGFAPADDPEVLVYVVIDEPAVDDQAHSTFASGVFSEIMSDILPYLNVFPETETEEGTEVVSGKLPESEGLTDNSMTEEEEETVEETKVYETEEYVDEGAADSGVPGELPDGSEVTIESSLPEETEEDVQETSAESAEN
ncbi:MAG: penicillin-binding protein 2 [Clostridiales bacterium]|nr:penicillin-binding protein 2 [Clostridiales bacterium]